MIGVLRMRSSLVHGPPCELERFLASLVTRSVALYPATADADKISFNQINKNTGNRVGPRLATPVGFRSTSTDVVSLSSPQAHLLAVPRSPSDG
jgi:hypothetical protein